MTRSMYDGITAADVPDGWGVAGYIDGNWPDFHALTLRWPAAVHISIAASAADDAKALDVETGDAIPAQAPGWVTRQRARGDANPWVYCNESTWPQVIYEFALQKVPAPLYWIALYDGVAVVPPRAIAKQHTNTPGYDVSVVADYVPGIDSAPQPAAPAAHLEEDDDMQQIEPLSVHPGLYNVPTVNKGHFRLTVGDGGTADVRVVAWDGVGNALVLCGDKNDGAVKKGARDFAISAGTVAFVTVQRRDSGSFPIGVTAF